MIYLWIFSIYAIIAILHLIFFKFFNKLDERFTNFDGEEFSHEEVNVIGSIFWPLLDTFYLVFLIIDILLHPIRYFKMMFCKLNKKKER